LVTGRLNKQITAELGIAEYTVQIHRGNIMRKMKADSFATLVKLAETLKPQSALFPKSLSESANKSESSSLSVGQKRL
jgi:hypothetical protein